MASADSPRNPLQTCLQNLNSWFDSLPKPQIRLPWQPERSGSNKSLSASSPGSGDYSISGSQQSSASYHIEGRRPSPLQQGSGKPAQVGPVDKDELGRATWTFLHVLAAQYPEQPTKTQQKDVRALVDVLTRIYPCADCAAHFKELVREHPPTISSGPGLRQWMCVVHNEVNKSLNKPNFNCNIVDARWGALDCGDELACDLTARPGR